MKEHHQCSVVIANLVRGKAVFGTWVAGCMISNKYTVSSTSFQTIYECFIIDQTNELDIRVSQNLL